MGLYTGVPFKRRPRPVTSGSFSASTPSPSIDPRWSNLNYVVKERRLTFGRQYRIFGDGNVLVAYCKQKMFRLREDIRFFADESQAVELFRLRATKIIDFSGNFEVVESASGRVLGYLRRRGWKSLVRDEWLLFDAEQRPMGRLIEASGALAIVRRLLELLSINLLPYTYDLRLGSEGQERTVGTVHERFQFFADTYDVRLTNDAAVDSRLILGLTVCIDAIEGE